MLVKNPFEQDFDFADYLDQNSADRIGRRIRKIREEQDMTLAELASKVGISSDMLQKYENGQRKPKTDRLKEIARALGVFSLALVDHALTSDFEVMSALFQLEEYHDLSLIKKDDQVYMKFSSFNTIDEYINKWYEVKESIQTRMDNASDEEKKKLRQEYCNWKWRFPEALAWKPSREDKIKEKEAIEEQIEVCQKRLKEINKELESDDDK